MPHKSESAAKSSPPFAPGGIQGLHQLSCAANNEKTYDIKRHLKTIKRHIGSCRHYLKQSECLTIRNMSSDVEGFSIIREDQRRAKKKPHSLYKPLQLRL